MSVDWVPRSIWGSVTLKVTCCLRTWPAEGVWPGGMGSPVVSRQGCQWAPPGPSCSRSWGGAAAPHGADRRGQGRLVCPWWALERVSVALAKPALLVALVRVLCRETGQVSEECPPQKEGSGHPSGRAWGHPVCSSAHRPRPWTATDLCVTSDLGLKSELAQGTDLH